MKFLRKKPSAPQPDSPNSTRQVSPCPGVPTDSLGVTGGPHVQKGRFQMEELTDKGRFQMEELTVMTDCNISITSDLAGIVN